MVARTKDNNRAFEETALKMNNMEIDLMKNMEETGKSLNAVWNQKDEDNKAAVGERLAGLSERLDSEDRKLCELSETVEKGGAEAREYQENNDANIHNLNEVLIRFVV